MSHRTRVNHDEQMRVMRLLVDVAAMKGDPTAQRQTLVDGLNAAVGTNQAFFFVCDDWRPGPDHRPRFVHQTLSGDCDATFLRYMSEFGVRLPLTADAFCAASILDPAAQQSWTFDRVLPGLDAQRRFPEFMDIIHSGRISDGAVVLCRQTGGERVAGFGLHHFGDTGRLRPRQRAVIDFAMSEVQHLIDRGHLGLPPAVGPTLSPRLQQVLDRLLAGVAPKRIAWELGLSPHTVREYVKKLYADFGVGGRTELILRCMKERRPAGD